MAKILTEVLRVQHENCPKPGFYLRWKNDYGHIDQWLFDGNIIQEINISDVVSYKLFIDDMLGITKNFETVNKRTDTGLRIFTTFDKDNAPGFAQLLKSRMIEMWAGGTTWYRVDVTKEVFDVQQHKTQGRIGLIVTLPLVYTE